MIKKLWYPIVYMFVVTAFFSSILIGLSRFTQARVEANQEAAFEKAVLLCLPLEIPEKISSAEAHRIFVDKVVPPDDFSAGAYRLLEGEKMAGYALPISGRGFWAEIRGVIGIEADRKTITGIAFHKQAETPGLGAEITGLSFRKQFVGKRIAEGEKPISFRPAGSEAGESDVHAITGATQTSTRLEKIINERLALWRDGLAGEGS